MVELRQAEVDATLKVAQVTNLSVSRERKNFYRYQFERSNQIRVARPDLFTVEYTPEMIRLADAIQTCFVSFKSTVFVLTHLILRSQYSHILSKNVIVFSRLRDQAFTLNI